MDNALGSLSETIECTGTTLSVVVPALRNGIPLETHVAHTLIFPQGLGLSWVLSPI